MKFQFKERCVDLTSNIMLMGIINVTPDSFSENGKNFESEAAVQSALKMINDGADIIDIGGESSRPGAESISSKEEIRRIQPVIKKLRNQSDIPISIDTTKSDVAEIAMDNGADIINDISGFYSDHQMKYIAGKYNSGCIVMHMRGSPKTMQNDTKYTNIIEEISIYFKNAIVMLGDAGTDEGFICLDPGIGFGKSVHQNLLLINKLSHFNEFERPILIGPSRKSFIGNILNNAGLNDRIWGTAGSVSTAITRGARIVRVHDVAEMKDVCTVTNLIINAE